MAHNKKLEDLVHYIISLDTEGKLGAIKLNKILWYSDIRYYIRHKRTISGVDSYIKQERGPVLQGLPPILSSLEQKGKIQIDYKYHLTVHRQTLYKSLQDCTIKLKQDEREALRYVFSEICNNHTAASISESTHNIIWDVAKIGEKMPVYTILASIPGIITDKDTEWALKYA